MKHDNSTSSRCLHPVCSGLFATFEPDPIGVILGTGYNRFTTAGGMAGLAKITGDRLDVLAVAAALPGVGQFRRFIADAKLTFKIVGVWEDWNPILGPALKRYGFNPATCMEARGEVNHGWIWESQNRPSSPIATTNLHTTSIT